MSETTQAPEVAAVTIPATPAKRAIQELQNEIQEPSPNDSLITGEDGYANTDQPNSAPIKSVGCPRGNRRLDILINARRPA